MADMLTIAHVSRRSGVAASALRYYEALGLLSSERSPSGHRRFRQDTLRRVAFIVFAQAVGLSLDEALSRKRRRDSARARRQLVTLRTQLLALERRLEELAATARPRSFADAARAAGAR